jgi:hypothetical protein
VASTAQARTWHVNTAGTGDAPTLHAAMDSATVYDSVLVAPGDYALATTLEVPPGVHLIGASGPAQTLIHCDSAYEVSTIYIFKSSMSGIHVLGNTQVVLFVTGDVDNSIVEGENHKHLAEGISVNLTSLRHSTSVSLPPI